MNIKVDNLCKNFGKVHALSSVSFELTSGSVTGFVGPNGAGKSTAMRIMAGRDYSDSGDVLYDNVSMRDYPEKVIGKVGYMPDSLPNSKDWRVEDYLDFFARAAKLKGEERLKRLEEVIEFTNLNELRDYVLCDLSKGMKQRVSFARVLLANPDVLLLDEPAAGLDPRARVELRDCIKELAKTGKTILISSHILSELEDICDSMIIIEKGVMLNSGSMQDLEIASTDNPIIMLDFTAIDEELIAKVESFTACLSCEQKSRRQLKITINGDSENLNKFMIEVFQNNLPVTGFAREGYTLESIFLKSTSGEVQ